MKTDTPQTIYLKDYTTPAYLVDTVDIDVDFTSNGAVVTTISTMYRNAGHAANAALVLDGFELETLSVAIDGKALSASDYVQTAATLTLQNLPERFELKTVVRIRPDKNTRLAGLYRSTDGYFTQCEAQGFRSITWFQDRPDVMANKFTVTLHADKATLPVLLANGNPIGSGDEASVDGRARHWAKWEDPFAKPCYLFAIVAAKLDVLKDTYTTMTGRTVNLAIYVEPGKLDQCGHAMEALKKSMKWDEEAFGLECDLDYYMIAAVGDFNMGAMENKGLNIFNTKYVLARPDVATDTDYVNIDRVVAHEYFHNWTGNRVTCRDWFQLSLKEGLTVFRDQSFGKDVHNRNVTHIQEVRTLRAAQFPEDAGPMAHPVRPSSYVEINNFYTATVYEKGAQVIAMMQTLIGKATFRKGMDLYFERHDGQAVTCDDFFAAMRDASGGDASPLTPQFLRWYEQAGTPHVAAKGEYDAAAQRYTLTLKQSCAPSPGQPTKEPYLIPVTLGLVGPEGADLPLTLDGKNYSTSLVLQFTQPEQTFVFEGIDVQPVPSLLRGFSAPVVLDFDYTDTELTHLMAYDSDAFNRWEAGQRLAGKLILDATKAISAGQAWQWPQAYADAITWIVEQSMNKNPASGGPDWAFTAELLTLPGEATLAEQMDVVDPDALHAARTSLRRFIAETLQVPLNTLIYVTAPTGAFEPSTKEAGRRALRNVCLGYLAELNTPEVRAQALKQFETADNMTDQYAALSVLTMNDCPERKHALDKFHEQWKHEALVLDKWLLVQATSRLPSALAEVKALTQHPSFDIKNPNKVYSLLRAFGSNHVHFHAADGSGYRFLAEQLLVLNAINPQVASRIARCFDRWRKFDTGRQQHAKAALESVRNHPGLSRDVFEIVDRALS